MSDSDDYFSDDIVLDDQTLAVLDAEESKFKRSLSSQLTVEDDPPPAKRQKTASGWQLGRNLKRTDTLDDMDDLPEISVRTDGTYDVQPSTANAISQTRASVDPAVSKQPVSTSNCVPVSRGSVPPPRGRGPFASGINYGAPPGNRSSESSRHASVARSSRPSPVSRGHSAQPPPPNADHANESPISAQLELLRRQMDELRNENLKMQTDLRKALDARFAKEGEVSILRKGIEKTAQDHAASVARLKAAKEEADVKQLQMKKEMKEEMERLKTQFTFKQHEMETSVRKAPWSVRSNKIGKGPPPTPVPLPSQMLAWNQNTSNAGPSRAVPESPRRPRFGDIPRIDRSKKLPNPDSRNMPTGFQATTFPSSPSRSQNAKGKGTANAIFGAASQSRVASAFESGSQIFNGGPHPPSPPSSPIRGAFRSVQSGDNVTTVSEDAQYFDDNPEPNADVEMTDGTQPPFIATPFEEEIEEVEPRIWSIDLHRSIMTHIAPDRKSSTFQVLMRAPAPSQCAEKYSLSSAQLLEVLSGTPHSDYDWDYTIGTVCQSLVQMAQVLSISSSIPELSALFSLLAHLTYTIPAFHSVLLSPCEPSQGEKASPQILLILCAVIREKFVDIKEGHEETTGLASLVKETLGFLESMCWNLPDELENQLALIPRSPTILAILLDGSRPQWMLGRSTRLLVWFSTRRGLFRSLLSFPEPETPIPEKKPVDFTRLPHIETLCSHLADTSRIGPDADSMKTFILAFFAMLSVSHPDALTILVESQAVIPSLVLYLTHLSMILWEDDQMLMASPSTASSLIRSMNQTLCLFHHLIFHAESMPNLRERLEIAPARQYNGLIHMFIVTIGRMSYAEPPEWVNARDKLELEQLSDLARELLEEVVEGPEGDSIWATYQEDPDRKSDVVMDDDEEAEARRLDANVL